MRSAAKRRDNSAPAEAIVIPNRLTKGTSELLPGVPALKLGMRSAMCMHLTDNITQHGHAIGMVDGRYHELLMATGMTMHLGAVPKNKLTFSYAPVADPKFTPTKR